MVLCSYLHIHLLLPTPRRTEESIRFMQSSQGCRCIRHSRKRCSYQEQLIYLQRRIKFRSKEGIVSLRWHFKARLIRKEKGDGITHLRVGEKDELLTRGLNGKNNCQ
ncbi:hypothetical protein PVAP13_5KG070135 [Panicum virgatum]|uniref:Uncharacterized protein n=1 Tax=Panicum virgatum TaxID=38727 RepID=A0A8T0SAS6_PANVG|nr:hypothetical protein PVAP13_5KG070135 [Panicum virgatum]